jgi:radical SAM protein with 4Fe4S-binding SPASM domain
VGLYTIVSTNAQALNCSTAEALVNSGLNRIIVSIDGFSEESYQTYRVGGSLQKALDALRCLANAKRLHKSHIRIELQTLRLKTNEHEWNWIKKNYKQLGATHLAFKTAQLYDFEHGHPLMPTNERYSRYRKTADGTYVHKSSHLSPLALSPHRLIASRPCLRLWSGCVITTNGDVLPCCYDKDHKHTLGNITSQTLPEIFHGPKAHSLRSHILRGHLPEMCKNCDK